MTGIRNLCRQGLAIRISFIIANWWCSTTRCVCVWGGGLMVGVEETNIHYIKSTQLTNLKTPHKRILKRSARVHLNGGQLQQGRKFWCFSCHPQLTQRSSIFITRNFVHIDCLLWSGLVICCVAVLIHC